VCPSGGSLTLPLIVGSNTGILSNDSPIFIRRSGGWHHRFCKQDDTTTWSDASLKLQEV
jgi:hypothetical protein